MRLPFALLLLLALVLGRAMPAETALPAAAPAMAMQMGATQMSAMRMSTMQAAGTASHCPDTGPAHAAHCLACGVLVAPMPGLSARLRPAGRLEAAAATFLPAGMPGPATPPPRA